MMEGTGSLEQQLATLRQRAGEVRARRADLRRLEELGMFWKRFTIGYKYIYYAEMSRIEYCLLHEKQIVYMYMQP